MKRYSWYLDDGVMCEERLGDGGHWAAERFVIMSHGNDTRGSEGFYPLILHSDSRIDVSEETFAATWLDAYDGGRV